MADAHPSLPRVSLSDVSRGYRVSGELVSVLEQVTIDIPAGDSVAIVGESGIGKSTLLQIIGSLDRPDTGCVRHDGINLKTLGDRELSAHRNRFIGFMFQFHHLLPEFTALENVMMPALIQGGPSETAMTDARNLLARVGLSKRLQHRVTELSGGEQQRVALARALVLKPRLLLADEPTGNLDHKNSEAVHDLLFALHSEFQMTSVIVTHNRLLAERMHRRVSLADGRLVEVE
ncbi:MAG: lipoprotein-releasing system ATP-binding protein LolD [Deltaproteobacteria bacterium]|nr:MAG: lipoprotein-releasing system ATP-binding protein LolD [Deltaproteobacteria bacterium]